MFRIILVTEGRAINRKSHRVFIMNCSNLRHAGSGRSVQWRVSKEISRQSDCWTMPFPYISVSHDLTFSLNHVRNSGSMCRSRIRGQVTIIKDLISSSITPLIWVLKSVRMPMLSKSSASLTRVASSLYLWNVL